MDIISMIKIIKDYLQEYQQYSQDDEVETMLIFDETRGHYQLLAMGWQNQRRIHHAIIHIQTRNGKVWLQQNSTDVLVAEELVERGIPKDHIVLGFQPEHRRLYTDYAVA